MSTQLLLLAAAAVLALALLYWALFSRPRNAKEAFPATVDRPTRSSKPVAVVTLYWADWCPHCTAFKQTWAAVKQTASSKAWPVEFKEVDCSHSTATVTTRAGNLVRGFPTVFGVVGGNEYEYGGQRTAAAFASWVAKLGEQGA